MACTAVNGDSEAKGNSIEIGMPTQPPDDTAPTAEDVAIGQAKREAARDRIREMRRKARKHMNRQLADHLADHGAGLETSAECFLKEIEGGGSVEDRTGAAEQLR